MTISPLGPMVFLAIYFDHIFNTRHEFPPLIKSYMKWKEWLVPHKQSSHYCIHGHIFPGKSLLQYAGSSTGYGHLLPLLFHQST